MKHMEKQYRHHVKAWWTSGRAGIVVSDSAPNAIHFTAPLDFHGLKERWTPEDLLLSAIASCFVTTFHALATYASFEYADFQVEAEGTFSRAESGYKFKEIVLRPTLQVVREQDEKPARKLLANAELLCLVSRAVSTPLRFEARVDVANRNTVHELDPNSLQQGAV